MWRRAEAPSRSEVIWPPAPATTTVISADIANVIPPSLVLREAAFWHRRWRHAQRQGDEGGKLLAGELNEGFTALLNQGDAITDVVQIGLPTKEMLKAWHSNGIATLAFAALSRETLLRSRGNVPSLSLIGKYPAEIGICGDFDPRQPEHCGFHVRREKLTRVLDIEWPGMTTPEHPHWYEGKQVVAAVFAPAQPTDHFQEMYEHTYRQPFDPTDFASVVPYLKTAVLRPANG